MVHQIFGQIVGLMIKTSAILKRSTIFLRFEPYHLKSNLEVISNLYPLEKSNLEVKYLGYGGGGDLVFVNSKVSVILGSHLGNGGHIERLRNESIAHFIQ